MPRRLPMCHAEGCSKRTSSKSGRCPDHRVSMIGKRFGMLTVVAKAGRRNRARFWECRCDCGSATFATTGHLNAGTKVTCGCTPPAKKRITHGLSGSAEYRCWSRMKERCLNSHNKRYPRYGGRGIRVCDHWMDFSAFLADMGPRPSPSHTLDRIDNDGNYEPGNCRWATYIEQNNNRTEFNRHLVMDGRLVTVAKASRLTGIPHATILGRLDRGWSDEEAIRND